MQGWGLELFLATLFGQKYFGVPLYLGGRPIQFRGHPPPADATDPSHGCVPADALEQAADLRKRFPPWPATGVVACGYARPSVPRACLSLSRSVSGPPRVLPLATAVAWPSGAAAAVPRPSPRSPTVVVNTADVVDRLVGGMSAAPPNPRDGTAVAGRLGGRTAALPAREVRHG